MNKARIDKRSHLPICLAVSLTTLAWGCTDPLTGDADADVRPDAGSQPIDAGDDDELLADAGIDEGASLVDDRPYELFVPAASDPAVAAPLILLLHGYGASGAVQAAYFGIFDVAEDQGMLVASPDGLKDGLGKRFWNATDACCNFTGSEVDDVAYLTAVIDDVASNYQVDPARIYIVGHSNGGFMGHRMACERADRIAAIVSLAGVVWDDPARCTPSEPVAILQVHGDQDTTIRYEGGALAGHAYPSAHATVEQWAGLNGCTGDLENTGLNLNLDFLNWGTETRVERYRDCPAAGGDVELWTIEGGRHSPGLKKPAWAEAIVGFLLAHPK